MTRFKRDRSFERALLRSSGVLETLEAAGQEVAEVARRLAPDDPATVGDDLKSSIVVESELGEEGYVVHVGATDFKGGWKEFGTSRERAKPFLRPALEQVVGPVEGGT